MSLTTRELTNSGAALTHNDGTLASGIRIGFTLCLASGRKHPTDVWDATTYQRVPGTTTFAVTDEHGEFTVNLWPNDRGNVATQYLCVVGLPNTYAFYGSVESSALPLTWAEFFAGATPLTAQDLTALGVHEAQAGLHLPSGAVLGYVLTESANGPAWTHPVAAEGAEPANNNIQTHIAITSGNPHGTTAEHIGAATVAQATQKAIAMSIVFGG